MNEDVGTCRLYDDLAWLWPLWGDPVTEYAAYCTFVTGLIERHSRIAPGTLLNIACGGGKNMFNLKRRFSVTGLDRSPAMLQLARALNPDCQFIAGDMRRFALDRCYDAILVDDGVAMLTALDELQATFAAAYRHLAPGGTLAVTADATRETFEQNATTATPGRAGVGPQGVEVVFVENVYDPDPADEHYEATYVYLIRERGALRIETDRCRLGLFAHAQWRGALAATGFEAHEAQYRQDEVAYATFVGVKPRG